MKHFLRVLWFFVCQVLWRGLKFVLRKFSGRCELQRLCSSNKPGARRTLKMESSLRNSRSQLLQSSLNVHPDRVEKTIEEIMSLKKINGHRHSRLGVSLQGALLQIVGYRALLLDVEKLRREPYDSTDPKHEDMLLQLWRELRPDCPLTGRISKQWSEIGFQGSDPKTDFRGMGLLGLSNLLYFAEHDKTTALQMLNDSLQPKHNEMDQSEWEQKSRDKAIGYSFAIVGINITELAYSLLLSGALKTHLYNVAPEMSTLQHFQQTFCFLMQEFHSFWVEEDPSDIMEFNRVRSKFQRKMEKRLRSPDAALCPRFSASDLHLVNL
ncbi:ELMO domain-containing protein 1 [Boleophthalmus pectinirostris]|uniref:ELMO domain-containing protein 1 n=1 Tax=Boleophthalmus pectinirostris TaxID=150288 RepID=UPI00242C2DA9|nr:ELMO domain-containing protein 1 [Boleophthalmus pectinirostris]